MEKVGWVYVCVGFGYISDSFDRTNQSYVTWIQPPRWPVIMPIRPIAQADGNQPAFPWTWQTFWINNPGVKCDCPKSWTKLLYSLTKVCIPSVSVVASDCLRVPVGLSSWTLLEKIPNDRALQIASPEQVLPTAFSQQRCSYETEGPKERCSPLSWSVSFSLE